MKQDLLLWHGLTLNNFLLINVYMTGYGCAITLSLHQERQRYWVNTCPLAIHTNNMYSAILEGLWPAPWLAGKWSACVFCSCLEDLHVGAIKGFSSSCVPPFSRYRVPLAKQIAHHSSTRAGVERAMFWKLEIIGLPYVRQLTERDGECCITVIVCSQKGP